MRIGNPKGKLINIDVPIWFLELGRRPDRQIAEEFGLRHNTVKEIRSALNIVSYQEMTTAVKGTRQRAKKYKLLCEHNVDKREWAAAMGFRDIYGLTADDHLRDWIYCYENNFPYNPRKPTHPVVLRKIRLQKEFNKRPKKQPLPVIDKSLLDHEEDPDLDDLI